MSRSEPGAPLAPARGRARWWAAPALLAAVVAATFPEVLLGRRVFFYRDIHSYWYPAIESFVRSVAEGSLPLWAPRLGLGEPLLANPGFQIAYPPTWLNLILPPAVYYALFVFGHLVGGGLGLVRLSGRLGVSPSGSLLAGIVWSASGPVLSSTSLWHHFAGAAWIPWLLVSLDRALREPGWRRWVCLGAVAAGQSLAGSADMCVLSAFGAVVWLGLRPLPAPWALLGGLPAALACALCLAAVQWLPALGLLGESVRSGYQEGANTFWSLHPGRIVELLLPIELGPLALSPWAREWLFDGREPLLASLYLGAGAAFLVAVALLTPGAAAATRVRAGLGVGMAVSLAAALGRHTPFYSLLLTLPPVALIRYPVKFTLLAVVFWSLLAGLGFDTLRAAAAATRSRLAGVAVAAGLALLAAGEALWPDLAAGWFTPAELGASLATLLAGTRAAALALVLAGALAVWGGRAAASSLPLFAMLGLVAADLVTSGRTVNPLAPPELLTHRPPILDGLRDAGEVRLFVDQPDRTELLALLSRGPEGWEPEPRWALGAIEMLRPPIGARFGIDGSYDGDLTGLLPLRLHPLEVTARTRGEEALRLLRRSAVTHVITLSERFDGLGRGASEWHSVFSEPIRLAALPGALPRAFAVDGVRVLREPESYAVLTHAGFDPLREVILPEGEPRAPAPGFLSSVRLVERSADRVVLDAELSGPGHVVLLDGFAAGWQARVDASPAPVTRANVAFRAVPVPEGAHRVVLAYRPKEVFLGAGLSAAGALVGLGLAWAGRGRRS